MEQRELDRLLAQARAEGVAEATAILREHAALYGKKDRLWCHESDATVASVLSSLSARIEALQRAPAPAQEHGGVAQTDSMPRQKPEAETANVQPAASSIRPPPAPSPAERCATTCVSTSPAAARRSRSPMTELPDEARLLEMRKWVACDFTAPRLEVDSGTLLALLDAALLIRRLERWKRTTGGGIDTDMAGDATDMAGDAIDVNLVDMYGTARASVRGPDLLSAIGAALKKAEAKA